jgi:hypothetical protein
MRKTTTEMIFTATEMVTTRAIITTAGKRVTSVASFLLELVHLLFYEGFTNMIGPFVPKVIKSSKGITEG